MSKLEELIQELCPDGVEYKKLGEIVEYQRGKSITKKNVIEGDIPVISGGQQPAYYHNESNREGKTITIAGSGAYAGYIMYWEQPIFVSDAFSLKGNEININTKYIYYYLKKIQEKIYSLRKGAGISHVYFKDMQDFLVPVPPLEVQCEIVRILDKFTLLTAELTAELTARRKQYEYYINYLLEPKENYKNIKMSDICSIITKQTGFDYSATIKPALVQVKGDDNLSFIQNKDFNGKMFNYETDYYIPKEIAKKFPKITLNPPSILFSISGKIGNVGLFMNEEEAFIGGAICICKLEENIEILPEYIMYYLQSKYGQKYLFKNIKAASHLNITVESIRELEIFYPDIEEQKRVVDILNRFDKLCNDITAGIPAEIDKRQKQYGFYKDLLLNFGGGRSK